MTTINSAREQKAQRIRDAIIPDDPQINLDEFQTAKLMNCSVDKLRRDRWSGGGIPFIKVSANGMVRYRRQDIDEQLNGRVCKSTSDKSFLFTRKQSFGRGPGRPPKF